MPITIQCPSCSASAEVVDSVSGKKVRCGKCGTAFGAYPTIDGEKSETKPASASSSQQFTKFPA